MEVQAIIENLTLEENELVQEGVQMVEGLIDEQEDINNY
jgi:hypothetical protein